MKKLGSLLGLKIGLAIFCAMTAMTMAAYAEDPKPAAAPAVSADDLKKALGLSIYLQAGYTYNANASSISGVAGDPGSENNLRAFDHKANSFTLDLAEIVFAKDPSAGVIGYKVKVAAGETAKLIHAAGLGSQPTGTANPESFDVTEAYASYTAAVGKGLRFDFGKYVTYHGAEVIEAIDNPNYSRSFLYNYAEPITHTGLKMSYAFTDTLNASLHVVNGWDNATDNNTGKSFGASVNYAPAESFSGYVNFMTGPEQADNNHDKRTLVDLVATIKPAKPVSIILNYDNGKEDHAALAGDTAKWDGLAGVVKYDINDTYSLSVRGEYFDDKGGSRTGTVQKLKEVTVTPEIRLVGGLILRPEYRHDVSNQQSFDNGTKKTQDTIALGAMYRW
jgi:hypothetical protein